MKLLMICGSFPPVACGIGDYTEKLINAMNNFDIEIELMANIDFSLSQTFKIIKRIKQINPNIIHIQYPAQGFGYGILPQILSLRFKTIVTIHEVSQFHPIRKLWLIPFTLRSNLIFTTKYELDYLKKIFPWFKNKSFIIPIGSNIVPTDLPVIKNRNTSEIISFGLIRPKKGIEKVLELAKLLKEHNSNYSIKIIGKVFKDNTSYYEKLRKSSLDLPIKWLINLSEKDVELEISKHLFAYLPFPDGASERRTSLLAMFSSNLLVFTTKGKFTPQEMMDLVLIVNDPCNLNDFLIDTTLIELTNILEYKGAKIKSYLNQFEWKSIASKHYDIYNQ